MKKVIAIYGVLALSLLLVMAGLLIAYWGKIPPLITVGTVLLPRWVTLAPILLGAGLFVVIGALWGKKRGGGDGDDPTPQPGRVVLVFGAAHGQLLLLIVFLWLLRAAQGGEPSRGLLVIAGVLLFLTFFFTMIFSRLVRTVK